MVGGYSRCNPKKCPPCDSKDLRPVVTAGCYCKCEPCPKHQKLCPSSGDCIPEVLWCNGIRDCQDDEDDTCQDKFVVTQRPIIQRNESKFLIENRKKKNKNFSLPQKKNKKKIF